MTFLDHLRAARPLMALTLAAALSLSAGAARAEYVGGGYLTDFAGCEAAGWPTGIEMFRARYNPAGPTGPDSEIVLDLAVGGTMIYAIHGDIPRQRPFYRARGFAVWGGLYRSEPRPRIRVIERRDAMTGDANVPGNPQIRMSLRIRNFNGRQGCVVTAHMMLRDAAATGPVY